VKAISAGTDARLKNVSHRLRNCYASRCDREVQAAETQNGAKYQTSQLRLLVGIRVAIPLVAGCIRGYISALGNPGGARAIKAKWGDESWVSVLELGSIPMHKSALLATHLLRFI